MFLYLHFEKMIKNQIKLNEYSINVDGRTFVHNFERIWPEHLLSCRIHIYVYDILYMILQYV